MKFMLTFKWTPDTKSRAEAVSRFLKTGGKPPEGATLLGRWTRADFSGGYDLLESDDPKALFEFALQWSDVMQLEITPVLEDEVAGPILAKMV